MLRVRFVLSFLLFTLAILINSAMAQPLNNGCKNSTQSSMSFNLFNDGRIFYDTTHQRSGLGYPQGSNNRYIFGGGVIIGTTVYRSGEWKKLNLTTFHLGSGTSYATPTPMGNSSDSTSLFHTSVFRSTDFDNNGECKLPGQQANWLVWNTNQTSNQTESYSKGTVIVNPNLRNNTTYPNGPVYVSDEDFISVFNDQDSTKLKGNFAKKYGYPINLQIIQKVYSWNTPELRNIVVVEQDISNISNDTLWSCYISPVFDFDIGLTNLPITANNDRVRYVSEDTTLNLVAMWSDISPLETGHGLEYLGIGFLYTPTIDAEGFIISSSNQTANTTQLGLKTLLTASIQLQQEDRIFPDYDLLTSFVKEKQTFATDSRVALSTHGFHLRPNDTARIAYAVCISPPNGQITDGTWENMQPLIESYNKIKKFYSIGLKKKYLNNVVSPQSLSVTFSTNTREIHILHTQNNIESLELFNTLGQVVFHRNSVNSHTFSVNCMALASGVYFCKVSTNNNSVIIPVAVSH